MGYIRKKKTTTALTRIIDSCDKLKNSINRLGNDNKIAGLSGGSLKSVDLKSDAELELTCRRTFDNNDVVVRIEAVIDKTGKAILVVNRNDLVQV
jgi:hypothetical protein